MLEKQVDVAIIGAGTAGLNARSAVDKAGKSWVLIESGEYGTTCARVGCMPSKLLISAADAAHEAEHADRFGISADSVTVHDDRVLQRVRRERDRFSGFVVNDTEALPAGQRLHGRAKFVGPTTLEVDDHTRVMAQSVVIATGSTFTDPEVSAVALDQFCADLDLRLNSTVSDALATEQGIEMRWSGESGVQRKAVFEKVLVAAGRRPATKDLNLEATGLELDSRGLPRWSPQTCQCGDLPIFLAGDASGHLPLLHEAADEGRIAGENSTLYPEIIAHIRRAPLAIAFTDPQIAMTGVRYADLDLDDVEIGEVSFDDQGRSRVMGQNRGLLRLYARRECSTLLGAEMFGPRMEHLAHLVAWAVQQKLIVNQALEMPFYHPVIEEGLRTALRDVAYKLRVSGGTRCEDLADEPGS
jgi:dihydrolipoamide dehydrogenase